MKLRPWVEFALSSVEAKICALILCILMLVRHFQFYYPFQSILNEMGHQQSIWGILLIPVTASFGFFAHMRRGRLITDAWNTSRLILLGLIPVGLAVWDGNVSNIFSYTYTDASARPRLLILLPIALSILVRLFLFRERFTASVLVVMGVFFIYTMTSSFVAHYIMIFLSVGLLFQYHKTLFFPPMWLVVFVYLFMTSIVLVAQIERVSVWYELIWTAGFVTTTIHIAKMAALRKLTVDFPPILYFYLCQAVVFNVTVLFFSQTGFVSSVIILIMVFFFTFYAALLLDFFEKKLKKSFLN